MKAITFFQKISEIFGVPLESWKGKIDLGAVNVSVDWHFPGNGEDATVVIEWILEDSTLVPEKSYFFGALNTPPQEKLRQLLIEAESGWVDN